MLKAAVGAILLLFVCACNAEQQAADPTEVRSDADEIQMLEHDITTAEEGSGTTELATTNLHSPQTLSMEAFELADDGSDGKCACGGSEGAAGITQPAQVSRFDRRKPGLRWSRLNIRRVQPSHDARYWVG